MYVLFLIVDLWDEIIDVQDTLYLLLLLSPWNNCLDSGVTPTAVAAAAVAVIVPPGDLLLLCGVV